MKIEEIESFLQEDAVDSLSELVETKKLGVGEKYQAEGNDLLHYAAKHDAITCIQYLKTIGRDLNVRNSEKDTPLMVAVSYGSLKTIAYLIDNGCDPNDRYYGGGNALFGLVDTWNHEIRAPTFRILIEKGADPDFATKNGVTFFQYAVRNSGPKFIKLIFPSVSNVNALDSKGKTALDYAELESVNQNAPKVLRQRYIEMVEFLKNNGATNGKGFSDGELPDDYIILGED